MPLQRTPKGKRRKKGPPTNRPPYSRHRGPALRLLAAIAPPLHPRTLLTRPRPTRLISFSLSNLRPAAPKSFPTVQKILAKNTLYTIHDVHVLLPLCTNSSMPQHSRSRHPYLSPFRFFFNIALSASV